MKRGLSKRILSSTDEVHEYTEDDNRVDVTIFMKKPRKV